DPAGQRGARAVLEVVERRERRRRREVRVEVDATWEHELARRVNLARGGVHLADRGDAASRDRHVGLTLAVRCDDEPAADGEVDHAVRRVKRSANATARPTSMSTWIQRSKQRRPRKTTIVSPTIATDSEIE